MVQFKRKKGESFEAFLRRFNRRLQQTGKLIKVRQKQFRQKEKNRNQIKESALIGLKLKKKNEYLRKIGKLEESLRK